MQILKTDKYNKAQKITYFFPHSEKVQKYFAW